MADKNTHESLPGSTAEEPAKPDKLADNGKRMPLQGIPHIHYKCHTEVLVEGRDMYHGFVKDLTLKGAQLYLEHNLEKARFIKLHIHIPPLGTSSQPHPFEVSAILASTVYDSSEEYFRSSVRFTEFAHEADQSYLQALLAQLAN